MGRGAAGGSWKVRLLTRPQRRLQSRAGNALLKRPRFCPSRFLRFLMGLTRSNSSAFGSVNMEQREDVNRYSSDLSDWRAWRVVRRLVHLLKASSLCFRVAARRLSGSSHTGKIFRSALLTLFSLDRTNTIDVNTKYYSSLWKVLAVDRRHSFHFFERDSITRKRDKMCHTFEKSMTEKKKETLHRPLE